VKRNLDKFPPDFYFRLTQNELQEVVENCDRYEILKKSNLKKPVPGSKTTHLIRILYEIL